MSEDLNQEAREQRTERREMRQAIGEKTPIQLGLFLALILIFISLIGASWTGVWWASKLSEKVDTVLRNQAAQTEAITIVQADVADLKAWRKVIDTAGSPQVTTLSKDLQEVKRELEIHMAQEKAK